MLAEVYFVLSQFMRLTDGRTDGRTFRYTQTALHRCSAVYTQIHYWYG